MPLEPQILLGRQGRVAVLELGSDIVEHAHPQAHALIKIDGPDRTILVAGRRYLLRDDTLILLRPWVPHGGLAEDSVSTRVLAVNLDLPYPLTGCAGARSGNRQDTGSVCRRIDPTLRAAADHLKQCFARGDAAARAADDVLDRVSETYAAADNIDADAEPVRNDFRIRRVIERIRIDPIIAQNVDDCVKISGLSRPHFFYLFRLCTGVTPRLYANSLRLEQAIDRLSNSSAPIHTVAESLGFSAPSHFTRFFLHHLGSTPRAYRHGVHSLAG